MKHRRIWGFTVGVLLCASLACWGQEKRKVIVNQDVMGPAGTDCQSILEMVQSPAVDVLGITIVTGDGWRDEEVAHALRLLEWIGRTDIPVVPGAEYPVVRRKAEIELWEKRFGHIIWLGAWTPELYHSAEVVPPLPEGQPTTKPSSEDAAHFMIRIVHKYPHQVTIWEGGPMTTLAQAISLDPEFPRLAKELVFMGGSLNPETDNPEFVNTPRLEFNFYFDPEAAHIALSAHWAKIVGTPVDISVKTHFTADLLKEIARSQTPAALYMAEYARPGGDTDFLWDELSVAAWLDPTIITKKETRYMDVDTSHGAGCGNTLTWTEQYKPEVWVSPVEIQMDLDTQKFYREFVALLSAPTPPAP
jgi:inosine-uridine nucleoside N-ribohydrolase